MVLKLCNPLLHDLRLESAASTVCLRFRKKTSEKTSQTLRDGTITFTLFASQKFKFVLMPVSRRLQQIFWKMFERNPSRMNNTLDFEFDFF